MVKLLKVVALFATGWWLGGVILRRRQAERRSRSYLPLLLLCGIFAASGHLQITRADDKLAEQFRRANKISQDAILWNNQWVNPHKLPKDVLITGLVFPDGIAVSGGNLFVTNAAVPEPSTIILAAVAGLASLACRRQR